MTAPRDFPFGLEPGRAIPVDGQVAGDAERVAHFPSQRRWSAGRARAVNSTATSRTSHFQLERRRVAEIPLAWLSANAAQKTEGKFSCLQTLEISQNRKIVS